MVSTGLLVLRLSSSTSGNDYHLGVQLLLSFEVDVVIFLHLRAKIARIVLITIFSTSFSIWAGGFREKIGGEALLAGDLIPCDESKMKSATGLAISSIMGLCSQLTW